MSWSGSDLQKATNLATSLKNVTSSSSGFTYNLEYIGSQMDKGLSGIGTTWEGVSKLAFDAVVGTWKKDLQTLSTELLDLCAYIVHEAAIEQQEYEAEEKRKISLKNVELGIASAVLGGVIPAGIGGVAGTVVSNYFTTNKNNNLSNTVSKSQSSVTSVQKGNTQQSNTSGVPKSTTQQSNVTSATKNSATNLSNSKSSAQQTAKNTQDATKVVTSVLSSFFGSTGNAIASAMTSAQSNTASQAKPASSAKPSSAKPASSSASSTKSSTSSGKK